MAKWTFKEGYSRSPMDMVREFASVTAQAPNPMLYDNLITEEYSEWYKENPETINDLKELADLVYVCYGYANALGYDLDEAIVRVHQNNLGRCIQPDGTVQRREDGKILKNPQYPPVILSDLL
ncbi:Phosphoribosyl-ATP pyrophosphohydrolase-like [uncultured Caudovirales phage]|uniref:Phosphoribosyl-ATP pyrophosphohydrolase-like n=1 Tax=uncultured Caudovirales phage TaxID=2100421 RepID=A0A6J5TAM4_9CAUD|nr:Phosphoribosyl-ATP pyrophosphohydrolase-like [uncultured Caudovirales phage]